MRLSTVEAQDKVVAEPEPEPESWVEAKPEERGGGGWIGAGTGTRNLGGGSRVLMQAKWCAPVSPVPLEEYKITHPPDMGGPPHSPGPTYLQELAPVWNVL